MVWVLSPAAEICVPAEGFLLIAIANYCNPYGHNAWPSVHTLANKTRMSESTVKRHLRELEDRGVLVRGDQQQVAHLRADRRPVVWDLAMGVDGSILDKDYLANDIDSRGVNLNPRNRSTQEPRGVKSGSHGGSPVTYKPSEEPSQDLTSRLAPSELTGSTQPHRVTPTSRPPKKSTGPRRISPAEESPGTGRTVGIQTTTERVRHTKAARESISRPDSGGGLAAEFGQRAREAGLSGPQAVNGPALARSLTAWMRADNNPDTPERIRSMFDRFFAKPGGNEDYPLWRRFLSDGPRLRSTERKVEPTDWAQAQVNQQKWLEDRAAAGDIRAENALSGANRPWMDPKYAPKEDADVV